MNSRYKVLISNKNLYKEVELAADAKQVKIGTAIDCDFRLSKELFFDSIELTFSQNNNMWSVFCSDNLYLTVGDVRKLVTMNLKHGDYFEVRYQGSNNLVFSLEFFIDFDNGNLKYERKINISGRPVVSIGANGSNDIVLKSEYIKNDSITLTNKNQDLVLNIMNTTFGVYHNGNKAHNNEIIKNGDFISMADFSFYYKDGYLMTEANASNTTTLPYENELIPDNYPKFNRNTRISKNLNTEKIEVLDPPNKPQKPNGNIVLQLLPALAMIALTVFVRGFMGNSNNLSFMLFSVCSMSLGIITSIFTIVSDRKKYKKETEQRIEKYTQYIDKKKDRILKYRNEELAVLNSIHISSDDEIENINYFSGNLFDKTNNDDDFLYVRVGYGTVEAKRPVSIKKQERFETDDELAQFPEKLFSETKYIENAPVFIDLKKCNVLGVVGSESINYSFIQNLVLDICSRQYFTDVSIYFLIDEKNIEKYYGWLRWLPHVVDKNSGIRRIVYDDSSKNLIFENLYVELNKRRQETKKEHVHTLVFVADDWGIKTHPVSQFMSTASELNTTFIFFEDDRFNLPQNCGAMITLDDGYKGTLIEINDKGKETNFCFSEIGDNSMCKMAQKFAPVYSEEISLENSLTKNITFFEMLNILSVEDIDLKKRWATSEIYKTMKAPIGVKTKNEIVSLDLHEKAHGPHGLVAGTTGSGKSEVLQTYILSMATLFHPYEVGFVIIDFKGGGMVNQFKELPHLIGAITNIDGREINRSLSSIKAELKKRQKVFAEYNVNNINNYIKLYQSGKTNIPIPHLILIVDEFAELKAEQPEFMKELISAARIGRSLGVHLILATQKPAGQVNDQIWSNSKFKLCLKVQTKEDSNEVIKSPLASEIKEPGRAYLQVGNNEIFELFQSAYSGAPSRNEDSASSKKFTICDVDLCGRRRVIYQQKPNKSKEVASTQLDAIVSFVNDYCISNKIEKLPSICLPSLPNLIQYKQHKNLKDSNICVPIGIYDDPDNQLQEVTELNISAGNIAIIGSSQFGKTNMLQLIVKALADKYSVDEVNIYIMDFASMALKVFEGLNHVGGVVTASDDEKIKNFFRLIAKEISQRKEVFSKMGITSFNSYKEAGYKDIPQIVILIDNFLALRELYSEYEEEMLAICREGISLGICVIMTSLQTNGIGYKYMSNFAKKIALFCNSSDEYGSLFDRCRIQPKSTPGRGLIEIDKNIYEFQSYLSFEGDREIDRVQDIKSFIEKSNKNNFGSMAKIIPEIPAQLDVNYVENNYSSNTISKLPVGIDYDNVDFVELDLNKINSMAISGKEKSGKTNFVKGLLKHLQNNIFDYDTNVYLIDGYDRQLEEFSSYGCVEKYTIDVNELDTIFLNIEEELKFRKEQVQNEGAKAIETLPLLVCIIENQSVFEANVLSKQTVDCYKRIINNYKQLKVMIVFSNVPNINIAYNAPDMLKQIKEVNCSFVFDDLSNIKLFDFSAALIRQFKKPIELGDGYKITSDGSVTKLRTINYSKEY